MPTGFLRLSAVIGILLVAVSTRAVTPALTVTPSGTNVLLTWTNSATGFILQSNATVNSTSTWITITTPPLDQNGLFQMTLPLSDANPARFFRLVKGIIEPGATLTKLAGGFTFTEGATCDTNGNVFFVDQPGNVILKWSVAGQLSTFLSPSGHVNGEAFDTNGNLIACADEFNQLWSIAPNGTHTVIVGTYTNAYLNGPNDVWITPGGGIYVTDPFYARTWWPAPHPRKQDGEQVYYLTADRSQFTRVTFDLQKPNGITGTPDGLRLYVADIGRNRTYRYDIQPNGSLTNKTLFCNLGSDGMTIDDQGNLYLTGASGVNIVDQTGVQVGHIAVPESWTGNVCFGGPNHRTLFITASTSLYSLRLLVKGANPSK